MVAAFVAALLASPAPPAFEVAPGFRVELVASEPLVEAPISLAFDEAGRLWVVELRTYMSDTTAVGERAPANRVVILEDTDRDGRMDRRTLFLDGLVLPRGAHPCRGGALVIEPPWLLHCVDHDGDGRADAKRRLVDGFEGLENPEHAGNGPIMGHDNAWEFSQHPTRVRFDGRSARAESVAPHGQWGIAKDDAGRIYTTPNSQPLLVDLLPRTLGGAPRRIAPWGLGRPLVATPEVFPAGPTPGVNRGYQEGVLRADGSLASFTAACGPAIVRTDALGAAMRGAAIVCEAAGNLVVRYALAEREGIPHATRMDGEGELLRSRDERFRPVFATVGPDGALYIADMARGVIQHRIYLTDYLKGQIEARDLEAPLDLGRIWRIVPEDAPPPRERRAWPALDAADDATLVETLRDRDGWWRDTAQRLLVEREARGVEERMRELLDEERPEVRLHALWTLDGLGLLTSDDLGRTAADAHPWLRSAALRAATARLATDRAARRIVAAALDDPHGVVRAEANAALAGLPREERIAAAVALLRRAGADESPLERDALLAALGDATVPTLDRLLATRDATTLPAGRLERLLAAALSGPPAERDATIALLVARAGAGDAAPIAAALELLADPKRFGFGGAIPVALATEPTALLALGERDDAARDLATRCAWPAPAAGAPVDRILVERGRRLVTLCAGCHGGDGGGLAGLAPPLANSPLLRDDPTRLARVLLHGLSGGEDGEGRAWTSMPPVGLGDEDLAAVIAYLRETWSAGAVGSIDAATIGEIRRSHAGRARPWTREELGGATTAIDLFDGRSLEGWTVRGGAADFRVEAGAIVGTTRPNQPNTFLCTDRAFGDCTLELEFLVDDELNSGVQIRSRVESRDERERVVGPQIEIDPSPRAWTAGIYEEGLRGWLAPLAEDAPARRAFRRGEWNRLKVVAEGPRIRTWLNGVAAADLLHDGPREGFIALQVHGVGDRTSPLEVRWRAIRITTAERSD